MKFFITFFTCLFIVLSAFSQSKSYYFIQAQKNIELEVADSISAITWEKQNESGDFEILSGSSANVYAAPTESGTYRVLYHASCGDIISDSIEVVVYDTITEVINYTQVGAHHFYKSGVSPKEMKVLEFEAADLLQAGYSIENMALGGYFLEEFRAAGVSDAELTAAGIIGSITDTDGKVYTWVRVGEQIWMAQNMAYSCETDCRWEPSTCASHHIFYSAETDEYYYTVSINPLSGGTQYYVDCGIKACPDGWHVPSQEEWTELFESVGYDFSSEELVVNSDNCFENNCNDFTGQSEPLFEGGESGVNLSYSPGIHYSVVEYKGEVVAYQTSTYYAPAGETVIVYFTKQNQATNIKTQSWKPSVRCIRN